MFWSKIVRAEADADEDGVVLREQRGAANTSGPDPCSDADLDAQRGNPGRLVKRVLDV